MHQGTMLHLIAKAYKHSLGASLVRELQEESSIRLWVSVFLEIAQRGVNGKIMGEEGEERESHSYVP